MQFCCNVHWIIHEIIEICASMQHICSVDSLCDTIIVNINQRRYWYVSGAYFQNSSGLVFHLKNCSFFHITYVARIYRRQTELDNSTLRVQYSLLSKSNAHTLRLHRVALMRA